MNSKHYLAILSVVFVEEPAWSFHLCRETLECLVDFVKFGYVFRNLSIHFLTVGDFMSYTFSMLDCMATSMHIEALGSL